MFQDDVRRVGRHPVRPGIRTQLIDLSDAWVFSDIAFAYDVRLMISPGHHILGFSSFWSPRSDLNRGPHSHAP